MKKIRLFFLLLLLMLFTACGSEPGALEMQQMQRPDSEKIQGQVQSVETALPTVAQGLDKADAFCLNEMWEYPITLTESQAAELTKVIDPSNWAVVPGEDEHTQNPIWMTMVQQNQIVFQICADSPMIMVAENGKKQGYALGEDAYTKLVQLGNQYFQEAMQSHTAEAEKLVTWILSFSYQSNQERSLDQTKMKNALQIETWKPAQVIEEGTEEQVLDLHNSEAGHMKISKNQIQTMISIQENQNIIRFTAPLSVYEQITELCTESVNE